METLTAFAALPGSSLKGLEPHASDMRVLETTETSFRMQALVNVTNPTPYTASVPYISIYIFNEGHHIGEVIARDIDVHHGNNTNISVYATWDPLAFGGNEAREKGRQLLSDYLSGKNTTLTLKPHRYSIPTMPEIGEALLGFSLNTSVPRFRLPGDDNEEPNNGTERQRFIREANFHIFSSTATFMLASPLHHNVIYLERVNATAFYNHTEPVGQIVSNDSFAAPPGLSETPGLPVDWSPSHVGYDKLKKALGGSLKLDAIANVTIRVDNWCEDLVYEGQGIGAKVHL